MSFCYRDTSLASTFFFLMLIYLIFRSASPTQGSFQFNLNFASGRHGRPKIVSRASGMCEHHGDYMGTTGKGSGQHVIKPSRQHGAWRSSETVMGFLVPVEKTPESSFSAKKGWWTRVLLQGGGKAFRMNPRGGP